MTLQNSIILFLFGLIIRAVQYGGNGAHYQGGVPPPIKASPPTDTFVAPPPEFFFRVLHAQYTSIFFIILTNKIRFSWIGNQYTSYCC